VTTIFDFEAEMKLKNYIKIACGFSGEFQAPAPMESINAIAMPRRYFNGSVTWNELRFWPNENVSFFRFNEKNQDALIVPKLRCKICESELKTYAAMCPDRAWNWICRESQVDMLGGAWWAKISEDMRRAILQVRPTPDGGCPRCFFTPAGQREKRIKELNALVEKSRQSITSAEDELNRLNNKLKMDKAAAELARQKSASRISDKMRSTAYFQTLHAVNSLT